MYELTGEYITLLELAEDPSINPDTLRDTLEAVGGEIEEKADGYAKVIAQMKSDTEGLKAEIARLTAKKAVLENNIQRIKDALQAAMEATGKTKFKTALFGFGIQKNPPSAVLDDEKMIPAWYLIPQDPKIDRAAILKDLKAGKEVPGAHMEQGESLRIR